MRKSRTKVESLPTHMSWFILCSSVKVRRRSKNVLYCKCDDHCTDHCCQLMALWVALFLSLIGATFHTSYFRTTYSLKTSTKFIVRTVQLVNDRPQGTPIKFQEELLKSNGSPLGLIIYKSFCTNNELCRRF